ATELAKLRSASDWMESVGHPVPIDLAVRWARHALVGLSVCHLRNLLHRDIKPSNLFLQSLDLCQLGDFGVAELMDANGEAAEHGTLQIRAPEGIITGRLTVRSDIYSVGVTLYMLLTGAQFPFGSATEAEVKVAITAGRLPKLRDWRLMCPGR